MDKKKLCLAVLLLLSLCSIGQENQYLKYYEYKDSVVAATLRLNSAFQQSDTAAVRVHLGAYYHYFQMMDSTIPITDGLDLPHYYYASEDFSDTATAKRLLFRMADMKWCDREYLNTLRNEFHLDQRDYWDSLSSIIYRRPCRNMAYIAELDAMSQEDKRLRHMLDSANADQDSLWRQITTTDSVHVARLKELILMYGFPTFSNVGFNGNINASLLAQHGGPEFLAWYVPQARIAADNKDYCLDWIAYMIDRDRTFTGLPQLYGSQLIKFGYEQQSYFYPIADVDHLQERRYQVGLSDIQPYYEFYGLDSVIIHPMFCDYSNYHHIQVTARVALAKGDTISAIRWLNQNGIQLYPFIRDLQWDYNLLIVTGRDSLANECRKRMIRCGYIPSDDTSELTLRFMADYREQLNEDWSQELRSSLSSAEAFTAFLQNERPRYSTEAWEEPATLEGLKNIVLSLPKNEAKSFLATLFRQVTKGNLHPEDYALIYDVAYCRHHSKCLYGTLDGVKIHCRKNVDKRRERIGLPPLMVASMLSNSQSSQ